MARGKLLRTKVLMQRAGKANREPIIQIYEYAFGFFEPYLSARMPPITDDVTPDITIYTENKRAIYGNFVG